MLPNCLLLHEAHRVSDNIQVDVIQGKQGENRLVITLNGKVSHILSWLCLTVNVASYVRLNIQMLPSVLYAFAVNHVCTATCQACICFPD